MGKRDAHCYLIRVSVLIQLFLSELQILYISVQGRTKVPKNFGSLMCDCNSADIPSEKIVANQRKMKVIKLYQCMLHL